MITRDPDVTPEMGALMQAFNHCADGYGTLVVLEASANMLVAAIVALAKDHGATEGQARAMANEVGAKLEVAIASQWERTPQPTDIVVQHGH
jgi:hypothetical protein